MFVSENFACSCRTVFFFLLLLFWVEILCLVAFLLFRALTFSQILKIFPKKKIYRVEQTIDLESPFLYNIMTLTQFSCIYHQVFLPFYIHRKRQPNIMSRRKVHLGLHNSDDALQRNARIFPIPKADRFYFLCHYGFAERKNLSHTKS